MNNLKEYILEKYKINKNIKLDSLCKSYTYCYSIISLAIKKLEKLAIYTDKLPSGRDIGWVVSFKDLKKNFSFRDFEYDTVQVCKIPERYTNIEDLDNDLKSGKIEELKQYKIDTLKSKLKQVEED